MSVGSEVHQLAPAVHKEFTSMKKREQLEKCGIRVASRVVSTIL